MNFFSKYAKHWNWKCRTFLRPPVQTNRNYGVPESQSLSELSVSPDHSSLQYSTFLSPPCQNGCPSSFLETNGPVERNSEHRICEERIDLLGSDHYESPTIPCEPKEPSLGLLDIFDRSLDCGSLGITNKSRSSLLASRIAVQWFPCTTILGQSTCLSTQF